MKKVCIGRIYWTKLEPILNQIPDCSASLRSAIVCRQISPPNEICRQNEIRLSKMLFANFEKSHAQENAIMQIRQSHLDEPGVT